MGGVTWVADVAVVRLTAQSSIVNDVLQCRCRVAARTALVAFCAAAVQQLLLAQ